MRGAREVAHRRFGVRRRLVLLPATGLCVAVVAAACHPKGTEGEHEKVGTPPVAPQVYSEGEPPMKPQVPEPAAEREQERRKMVDRQIRARGVRSPEVLEAMLSVPRHRFVPSASRSEAYADRPLSIGHDQTISQPYIVALMTELADVRRGEKVLDVGTGSGYQAAVLAELTEPIYSIEIVCPLAEAARERLRDLGYDGVEVRCGDGYRGWAEHAPFDAIVVAAAPHEVPPPLIEQLAPGGRLVIPVGGGHQDLVVIAKDEDGKVLRRNIIPVRFVPMTGEAEDR